MRLSHTIAICHGCGCVCCALARIDGEHARSEYPSVRRVRKTCSYFARGLRRGMRCHEEGPVKQQVGDSGTADLAPACARQSGALALRSRWHAHEKRLLRELERAPVWNLKALKSPVAVARLAHRLNRCRFDSTTCVHDMLQGARPATPPKPYALQMCVF